MRMAFLALLVTPLASFAQAPVAPVFDEAFFKGDPRAVMVACADQALHLKPGKERVLAQAGRIQLAGGNEAKAQVCFRGVVLLDAETARWMGQGWLEAGAPDKGIAILAQTPLIGWGGAKDELRAGAVLLMKAGHPREADKLMSRLFQADPGDWQNIAAFARSCLGQGRSDLAAAWYARAMASRRNKAAFWSEIALSLAEEKQGPGSQSLPALEVPKQPDAAFFSQDSKRLMLLCAEEAHRLDPLDPHLLAARGEVWLSTGDRAKAEMTFAEAVKRDPGDPRTRRLIAAARMRHGFREEALLAYQAMTALTLSGRFDNRKNVLCWAAADLMEAGFGQEAAGFMDKSYGLDKDDPDNCIQFGRAALLAGQSDLAALYFARAIKAEPTDVDVWLDIASAHADHLLAQASAGGLP
jgi:tetratricopeptide (TPR) repeat protein